jgi:hypothetical protein
MVARIGRQIGKWVVLDFELFRFIDRHESPEFTMLLQ